MTTVSRYVMTLLLVYVCVCALPSTCSGAAAYNRVAVMPFDNVENDQALEPWRSGFAWRVACDLVQTEVKASVVLTPPEALVLAGELPVLRAARLKVKA